MKLFLAGLSYREIGAAVGLRSVSGVHRIVKRELAAGASRRDLLTDETFAIWQERTESLLRAHWEQAIAGDHRSAELCRKLLAQQARIYNVGVDTNPLPVPTAAVPADEVDGGPDELSKLRARRSNLT
ncbi:hypothetical protein ACTWP6_17705 [Mycobacterium sp. 4D054]|uniref:hypothetical protein n=1 Tax=Mycobacterium sp. 4D054 TaxID=3457440 RepID=UPI003FD56591